MNYHAEKITFTFNAFLFIFLASLFFSFFFFYLGFNSVDVVNLTVCLLCSPSKITRDPIDPLN